MYQESNWEAKIARIGTAGSQLGGALSIPDDMQAFKAAYVLRETFYHKDHCKG